MTGGCDVTGVNPALTYNGRMRTTFWLKVARPSLAWRAGLNLLVGLLALSACAQSGDNQSAQKPPATVTPSFQASTPLPATSEQPPTAVPAQPTATLKIIPTANLSPIPTPPPASADSELVIDRFEIAAVEEMPAGKRVTLIWSSNGGSARLLSGIRQPNQPHWQVPPSGQLTVELPETHYADPPFTLQLFDAPTPAGATESIEAVLPFEWPCVHDYFFEPAPALCPGGEPAASAAAEQPFEGGVMIWLEATDSIYVFYDDQRWQRLDDTWSEELPESDPNLVPPEGRFQPIRGFGKVWREQPEIRQRLGWALGVELAFGSLLQEQLPEEEGAGVTFLRTFNGQIFALTTRGPDEGDWVVAAS